MKINLKKFLKLFLMTIIMPFALIIAIIDIIAEERKYGR